MSLPKHNALSASPSPAADTQHDDGVLQQRNEAGPDHSQDEYGARDSFPQPQNETADTPSQPPFRPFFTLVEDAHSAEYYHPTVHYIFSDDDTDLITEAALRSLESDRQDTSVQKPHGRKKKGKNKAGASGVHDDNQHDLPEQLDHENKPFALPPPIPGTKEHFIILDVQPTTESGVATASSNTAEPTNPSHETSEQNTKPPHGPSVTTNAPQNYKITSAHSLSPSWQILDSSISPAPAFDSSSNSPTSTNNDPSLSPVGGLMLKLKGTSGWAADGKQQGQQAQQPSQTIEDMMGQFSKRMGELKMVIESGNDYDEPQVHEGAPTQTGTEKAEDAPQQ